jgi:hypothetical protein
MKKKCTTHQITKLDKKDQKKNSIKTEMMHLKKGPKISSINS